jgi:hypothetical protein
MLRRNEREREPNEKARREGRAFVDWSVLSL